METQQANFDFIARPYRWLEYLTLGRALEQCRFYFLSRLAGRTRALIFGDGDGRFLEALLRQNQDLKVDAVDTSATMLALLRTRCGNSLRDGGTRLQTHNADAFSYLASSKIERYDLVVTNFFLDCLTQAQVENLAIAVLPRLTPEAIWLVSEFRIPDGRMRFVARAFVRSLYLGFRILTGLCITSLPDHRMALSRVGFRRSGFRYSLFGMLTTEVWSRL